MKPSNANGWVGLEFEYFWMDFLIHELDPRQLMSIDSKTKKLRSLVLDIERTGVNVEFLGIEIKIHIKFDNNPEEWRVAL